MTFRSDTIPGTQSPSRVETGMVAWFPSQAVPVARSAPAHSRNESCQEKRDTDDIHIVLLCTFQSDVLYVNAQHMAIFSTTSD